MRLSGGLRRAGEQLHHTERGYRFADPGQLQRPAGRDGGRLQVGGERSATIRRQDVVAFRGKPVFGFPSRMSSIKNCLHQQGRLPETTLECIRYLRQSDPEARISVEVEKPGRQGLQELAAEADVVFYSKSWAEVCCE